MLHMPVQVTVLHVLLLLLSNLQGLQNIQMFQSAMMNYTSTLGHLVNALYLCRVS